MQQKGQCVGVGGGREGTVPFQDGGEKHPSFSINATFLKMLWK